MHRRSFLSLAGMVAVNPFGHQIRAETGGQHQFLVPGYHPDRLYRRGRRIFSDPHLTRNLPERYEGSITMLSRIDGFSGATQRALFPLRGHAVTNLHNGNALFCGMNHRSSVVLDTDSLDLVRRIEPSATDFQFGGHAVLDKARDIVLVSERRIGQYPPDRIEDLYGRICVRDATSLEILDVMSCQGIAPHQLTLLESGSQVAVANYGSAPWPRDQDPPDPPLPNSVEPSLTILEVATGRLLVKSVNTEKDREIRHLAGDRSDRLAMIQATITEFNDAQAAYENSELIYEPDLTDPYDRGYLPLPLLRQSVDGNLQPMHFPDPLDSLQGQSIIYEPRFDEFLATFTSSHSVAVFDAQSGEIKKVLHTDESGLYLPRGIALFPDGSHYAVSGHWQNIYIFRCGDHSLIREKCHYTKLLGHSHLTII